MERNITSAGGTGVLKEAAAEGLHGGTSEGADEGGPAQVGPTWV
jgi:hypothetical protein